MQKFERLRERLATVEAERDAAQAGEARAVEALSLIRKELGTIAQGYEEEVRNDFTSGQSHGWGMAYLHAVQIIGGITDGPALAWLDQQRAEAVEAERRSNTDVIRSLGPAFCDFFFGGPGEAEYLAVLLRQQRREAAAEALETARWRPIEECQIASWGDEEHIVWARLNGEWFIAAAQLFKADAIQEGYTHFMRLPKLGSAKNREGQ